MVQGRIQILNEEVDIEMNRVQQVSISSYSKIKEICGILFPSLTSRTFIYWVLVVNWVLFGTTLVVSILSGYNKRLLEIDIFTLIRFQANSPFFIKYQFSIQRLFIPIFLHAGLTHILMNTLSLLIFCSQFEVNYGLKNTVIIYLGGGVGGNILSAIANVSLSVGASTAICGILGAFVTDMIINWNVLTYRGKSRIKAVLFMVLMLIAQSIDNSVLVTNIDTFGHLGGFICGFALAYSLLEPIEQTENQKTKQKYYRVLTFGLYMVLIIGLFGLRSPL